MRTHRNKYKSSKLLKLKRINTEMAGKDMSDILNFTDTEYENLNINNYTDEHKEFNYCTGTYEPVTDDHDSRYETTLEPNFCNLYSTNDDSKRNCSLCTFTSSSSELMKLHHHNEHIANNLVIKFKCKRCYFSTEDQDKANQHYGEKSHKVYKAVSLKNSPESKMSCQKASVSVPTPKQELIEHINYSQTSSQTNLEQSSLQFFEIYPCLQCPFNTTDAGQFAQHILAHKKFPIDPKDTVVCPYHPNGNKNILGCIGCFYTCLYNEIDESCIRTCLCSYQTLVPDKMRHHENTCKLIQQSRHLPIVL